MAVKTRTKKTESPTAPQTKTIDGPVMRLTEEALGWRGVWVGRARVGYLMPLSPPRDGVPWRWQLAFRSEREKGCPTNVGDLETCRRDLLALVRVWLSAMGAPTAWVQTLRWEE